MLVQALVLALLLVLVAVGNWLYLVERQVANTWFGQLAENNLYCYLNTGQDDWGGSLDIVCLL